MAQTVPSVTKNAAVGATGVVIPPHETIPCQAGLGCPLLESLRAHIETHGGRRTCERRCQHRSIHDQLGDAVSPIPLPPLRLSLGGGDTVRYKEQQSWRIEKPNEYARIP